METSGDTIRAITYYPAKKTITCRSLQTLKNIDHGRIDFPQDLDSTSASNRYDQLSRYLPWWCKYDN